MNKLWAGRSEAETSTLADAFNSSIAVDGRMYQQDITGSMAHAAMLAKCGILTQADADQIIGGLAGILADLQSGALQLDMQAEDIHMFVEAELTSRIGDVGKKLHTARSRNDQVLVDLKLFLRDELRQTAEAVKTVFDRLQTLSEQYKEILMPGYTHLQIAMPSSFGLWFGAYAETLVDDMRLIAAAWHIANQNPLGSAAGYGSSFPLDREMTTRLLGFEALHYNVVAAQMSRGKSERTAANAIAAVAATIGRLAMDICLFMSQNFGFVSLPDNLTTGSSIMPHKKNPDVFEIMRGRCNRLQSVPNEIALLTANLPVGYHRDMQLLKDILFPATTEIKRTLSMCDFMLAHLKVNTDILDERKYDYLFTVEDVNRLVLAGVPFREAYKQVGMAVQRGEYHPTREVHHTHEGSIGNLCTAQIRRKMERVMSEFE